MADEKRKTAGFVTCRFPFSPLQSAQYRLKVNSKLPLTLTGAPFLVAGLKRIRCAASIAFSVNPSGKPRTTRMLVTRPSAVKTTFNTTVPCTLF
jgi:hypothetical protein